VACCEKLANTGFPSLSKQVGGSLFMAQMPSGGLDGTVEWELDDMQRWLGSV